ncbi:MAG: hypothetical protein KGJ23_08675 [Euryarchaeota archaeon]|nr:hypothetical protein [Euryarchaeota archaeon]MDE1836677.1 hypothetical protein [Euryarchaeota archaeon]MDE1880294.1 hypothetical protein [Euryarchaeota archaeon]MDE2044647.1 hypothetical protein [Thermoplasmata archaeon]
MAGEVEAKERAEATGWVEGTTDTDRAVWRLMDALRQAKDYLGMENPTPDEMDGGEYRRRVFRQAKQALEEASRFFQPRAEELRRAAAEREATASEPAH